MGTEGKGILHYEIEKTPISLFDFETTGLSPGGDRVVEISVLRFDPGIEPRIVFDTIVNPKRKVAATEIHGITDADVEDAPTFEEIAGDFLKAISDSVIASYNIYFDIKFLTYELANVGVTKAPPPFYLMYLKPMLGLGTKQSLEAACRELGIAETVLHIAAEDIKASGDLFTFYRKVMTEKGVKTFADLKRLKAYKFLDSFSHSPFKVSDALPFGSCTKMKSRHFDSASDGGFEVITIEEPEAWKRDLMTYWDALKAVLADLIIDHDELEYLNKLKDELRIPGERIRVLHARAFVSIIQQFIDDEWLDEGERDRLKKLYQCLSTLGWAPGE
ncbi:MAG: 3'-5' exonuclease [Planctomycetota bacterium]|jgi:DNA polymerase-3 subunit epsilon